MSARRGSWWLPVLVAALLVTVALPGSALPIFGRKAAAGTPLLVQLQGDASGLDKAAVADDDPKRLRDRRTGLGVVASKALDDDLNALLDKLQRGWPQEPPPARVHVVPDQDYQARTSESGDVFIAVGMLQSVESEDEVAALLAHEYSHVLLGHVKPSRLDQAAKGLWAGATLYALYRNDKKPDDTALMRQMGINTLAMETVSSGLVPAMTRKEEDAADRLGMDLMIRAGYNPLAMTTVLEREIDWEARAAALAEARAARAAKLDEQIKAESGGQVALDLEPLVQSMMTSIISNVAAGLGKLRAKLRREHADPTLRREAAREYLRAAHADAPRPELRPLPWAKQKDVQALFAGLADARDAYDLLDAEDPAAMQKVRALAEKANRTPAGRTALTRYVYAMVSPKKSEALFAQETKADDSLLGAHLQYMELVGRSDRTLAAAAYERAHAEFGDNPQLEPYAARFAPPKPDAPALGGLCENLKATLKATCQALTKGS